MLSFMLLLFFICGIQQHRKLFVKTILPHYTSHQKLNYLQNILRYNLFYLSIIKPEGISLSSMALKTSDMTKEKKLKCLNKLYLTIIIYIFIICSYIYRERNKNYTNVNIVNTSSFFAISKNKQTRFAGITTKQ